MYKILSLLSFGIRSYLCYVTIETTPIFANSLLAYSIDQIISLYTVLRILSYFIVGKVFRYERGSDPVVGVILYFFTHAVLVLITWGILAILTALSVMPV